MKMKFLRKALVLSGALAVIILCSIMLRAKSNEGDTVIDRTEVPDYQRLVKEIELAGSLRNFDKIEDAYVRIETSDSEISMVNIFLETNESLDDSEIDNISLFISENVEGLEEENVVIGYAVS